LQTLPEVCWGVVEQAHYVEAGRIHLQDQHLRFYRSIGECLAENKPNVILLSSVLQYLTDPYGVLQELLSIGSDTLIFDRTSYLNDNKIEIIKIQHVPKSIYQACYPCRFFVEENLCSYVLGRGYKLIETFGSLDRLDSLATWKGHIFAREMHA
jgi:putative methyltransferase (TIGR04325 family)